MYTDQDQDIQDVTDWLEDIESTATEEAHNHGVLVEEEVVIDVAM